jgi:phosphopantothenoylcysteine decarboxylase/phosphopantothenate--cysteine ligase
MGYAVARELRDRGAEVVLVSGPTGLRVVGRVVRVTSAEEMYGEVVREWEGVDGAVLCAAVADYTPAEVSSSKVKKGENIWGLSLKKTRDIAAELGRNKGGKLLVGFALETDNEEVNALGKLNKKALDYIVLNSLKDDGAGFGGDTNKVTIFGENFRREYPLGTKTEVAGAIVDVIEGWFCVENNTNNP